jgi:type IV secretion system protein VirB11
MERFEVPSLTKDAVQRLAEHVASATKQSVNEETPLLSAAMPHGERFQGVLMPAAPVGGRFRSASRSSPTCALKIMR